MLPFKRESNDDNDDHEDIRYKMICDKQKEEKDDNNNDIYMSPVMRRYTRNTK